MKIKSYIDFINEELQRVVSDQSASGRTKSIDTIWDDPSSAKSPSSSVLLRKQLRDQEFDDLKNMFSSTGYKDVPDWVIKDIIKKGVDETKFRKLRVTFNNLKFLKDKAKEGELRCEYCDKGPLVIYDFTSTDITPEMLDDPNFRFNQKFKESDGATCDHKQPMSKGGDKFDYSNLAVCCYDCNKRKGNMNWEEWKRLMKINENMNSNSFSVKLIDKSETTYDFIKSYLNVITYSEYINNENLYQVGAFKDDELIGLRVFRMKDGKVHLNYSAVSPSYRGQGINTMIYKKIEEISIKNGVNIITSNVRESNTSSLKSLLKCGFSINDRVDLFYPDGEKKIPLYKKLDI